MHFKTGHFIQSYYDPAFYNCLRIALEKDRKLDGLRGIAALGVFLAHFLLSFFPAGFTHYYDWVANSHALSGTIEHIISTPLISVLWNGGFQVYIFFVLSGYVLTLPFEISNDTASLKNRAAKRLVRLGIPVFASVVLSYLAMLAALYSFVQTAGITGSVWLLGQAPREPHLSTVLSEALYGVLLKGEATYNPILWTMRVELIGSMLIFAYRLLAWRGRAAWLSVCIFLILVTTNAPTQWPAYVAFLIGSYMAGWKTPRAPWASWAVGAIGLAIASIDNNIDLGLLADLDAFSANRQNIINLIGGSLVVYSVKGGAGARLLLSRPVQFIGRVSYSFYLIHLVFILSLSCSLFNWLVGPGAVARGPAALLTLAVTLPLLYLAAWAFERWIDQPTVRLCQRIRATPNGVSIRSP